MSGDSSDRHHRSKQHTQKEDKKPRTTAKSYTVETGDTLTAIAHKTGIPVAEILALNPDVDPQILIAGQTLKLR
jgi:LysM repeat protein